MQWPMKAIHINEIMKFNISIGFYTVQNIFLNVQWINAIEMHLLLSDIKFTSPLHKSTNLLM